MGDFLLYWYLPGLILTLLCWAMLIVIDRGHNHIITLGSVLVAFVFSFSGIVLAPCLLILIIVYICDKHGDKLQNILDFRLFQIDRTKK